MKVVDTSVEGDSGAGESRGKEKIVASARWYVIKTGTEDKGAERKERAEEESPWPTEEGDQELLALFFGSLAERQQKIMGNRPHYCTPAIVFSGSWVKS